MALRGLFSVGKAAAEFGISPSTVRNWIEKGYIQAVILPSGQRRIPKAEINRLLEEYFSFPSAMEEENLTSLKLTGPSQDEPAPAF